ncbi:DUF1120 domain-containing protein [Pseudomonas sp. NPDC007930]|uniref:DUF1120 domain-containing protein n=1 Tax=Pseudomonas sp. NPDC007930 TaxID=3364417 RepID=UPI0036E8503F
MRFKYLAALGLLASPALAAPAAPSAELSITGAITPGVCNVTLSNDGALDFGAYGYHDLKEDDWTELPSKGVRLDVTCGRSTTVSLDVRDNTPDPALSDTDKFSLGFQGEQAIGWYSVRAANIDYDGRTGQWIRQTAPGQWALTNVFHKNTEHAWATLPNQQPVSLSAAKVTLNVTPNIVPRKHLDTAQALALQGSLSIALRYL